MNRAETIQILATLKAAYPHSFKDLTKADAEVTINLWQRMFAQEKFSDVNEAIGQLICNRVEGYSPTIGEVKRELKYVTGDLCGLKNSPSFRRSVQEFLLQERSTNGKSLTAKDEEG